MGAILTVLAGRRTFNRHEGQKLRPKDPNPQTGARVSAVVPYAHSHSPSPTSFCSTPCPKKGHAVESLSVDKTDQTIQKEKHTQENTIHQIGTVTSKGQLEQMCQSETSFTPANSAQNPLSPAQATANPPILGQECRHVGPGDQAASPADSASSRLRLSCKTRFKRKRTRLVNPTCQLAGGELIGRLVQIPWDANFRHLWVDCVVVAYNSDHRGFPVHCIRFVDGISEWRRLTHFREIHDTSSTLSPS